MSHPDYEQTSHDHAALLVLLKPIGTQIKTKTVARLCERIMKSGNRFTMVDSSENTREIFVRFLRDYPVENTYWGDFQTHRRLLGLITFGKYDNQSELNELCRLHETLKVKYSDTLYDSRAILFGPAESENITNPPNNMTTPKNFKAIAAFYADETCPSLESQVLECLHSVFWILESKRVEKSKEKIDRVTTLLRAPFEKKEQVGVDLESRNNKKKFSGRMIKHLADLCLQAGLRADALSHYSIAANNLASVNDWLWLGAAYEGLCVASALIFYPNLRRSLPLQRNSSLQEGNSGRRRECKTLATPLPAPVSIEAIRAEMPQILVPDEIAIKYREAIVHYSNYNNAGIIETEASFKATRISIEQNCTLQAASFLNNVVFNHMKLNEQEKIDRFTKLSELYSTLGFSRKAAFCMRLAATRHVSPQNPNPDWKQCYHLMLQATPGFKLSLDSAEMTNKNRQGWPTLQIQILNDLIATANHMGNPALATRHMTFMLQTLFHYLSPTERKDIALQLHSVAQQCEGAPVPLVLESGIVLPPANLTNIPQTKSFVLLNLPPHLQPQKIQRIKEDHGPFLFTPINFGSLERKSTVSKSKMEYLWVEGDVCTVSIQLVNPLPFELSVSNMRLLTSGIVFDPLPESITLPADSGPITVTLAGTPKEVGDLEILGFITHTLGVESNCRLRSMEAMPHPQYSIEVVPILPKIDVATSLPQTASFSSGENIVTNASISLYGGESAECTITITNSGQVAIEMIDVSIQSALDALEESTIFKWDDSVFPTLLPLLPGTSASFTLNLYANAKFILPSSSGSGGGSKTVRLMSPAHQSKRQANLSQLAPPLRAANIIEGQLKIKYSGAAGLAAGYCRISSVFISIEMLPSVKITNWDVLPAETPSQFYLVLDVTNMTNQEMELHYTMSKCIYMGGRESCRIPVPVNRCPLSKLSSLNETDSTDKLQKVCAEYITGLVDLRWQLLGMDLTGKATLDGIVFTQDMLDLVRMSPLQWEVVINDMAVKPQDEITCGLGDVVSIGVGVCNALEQPLSDLTLSINFYQDHHNGVNNYRLDTRLSIAGANCVTLPTEYERAYHECRVVFFTAGQYKLDIQCSNQKLISTNHFTDVSSSGHVWRYIPAIEIAVDDSV